MTSRGYEPLRLDVHIAGPLSPGALPIRLDSLLAWCVTMDALQVAASDDARSVRELADDLPLERDPRGIWKASMLLPARNSGEGGPTPCPGAGGLFQSRTLVRRTDAAPLADALLRGLFRRKGFRPKKFGPREFEIQTRGGAFKNHLRIYALRDVALLSGWFIGQRARVTELLTEHVEFIGAYRRLGHGRVARIEVVADDRAKALWQLRPMPCATTSESAWLPMRTEPPYYAAGGACAHSIDTSLTW